MNSQVDPRQADSPVPIYNADGTYNDDYIRYITRHRIGGSFMPKNVDDEKHDGLKCAGDDWEQ